MTPEQRKIVEKWIGTPYAYRMREPGKGVDCVHLVVAIVEELNENMTIPILPYPRFWRYSDPALFERTVDVYRHCWKEITEANARFGDVVFFKDKTRELNWITHSGVMVEPGRFIHVLNDAHGRVRIDRLDAYRDQIKTFGRVI